jgi:hypothetical protein
MGLFLIIQKTARGNLQAYGMTGIPINDDKSANAVICFLPVLCNPNTGNFSPATAGWF